MQSIKNKIIQSLIKNKLISSEKEIITIGLVDKGLVNYIFSIELKDKKLIAKYATGFSRFAPEIKISRKRLEHEYKAISLWASLLKSNHFPKIVYYDKENSILVFKKIPVKYRFLDDDIFSGIVNQNLPKKLGEFLADLHNSTAYKKDIKNEFSDTEMLRDFKFPALYDNITKNPILLKEINVLKKDLIKNKICLVQGDFKPNNIFYTDKNFYLIDYEQTHYGDPALDVCYCPAIYILATTNNYSKAEDYYYCIESLWNAYRKKSKFKNIKKLEYNSLKHLGVIILSRTFGITKLQVLQKPRIRKFISNLSKELILGKIKSFNALKDHNNNF